MTEEMKQMAAMGLPVSFTASEQQGATVGVRFPCERHDTFGSSHPFFRFGVLCLCAFGFQGL